MDHRQQMKSQNRQMEKAAIEVSYATGRMVKWTDMAFYLMDEYLKEAVRDLKSSTKRLLAWGKNEALRSAKTVGNHGKVRVSQNSEPLRGENVNNRAGLMVEVLISWIDEKSLNN
ncbi:hypothetical protein [Klebsiella pneumoniae]|uniref:hypothetical protein n=1 Tax=Klebsiella pneumoniae TaxID=573 RepID=UPI001EE8AFBB|nr:hypothetical protein [Klebsiella pneumoniae]